MKIQHAKFYIAQIILQLEYLHSKKIIYRDLKPENLMIAKDGYLKLIDFGTAKVLRKNRTFTLMGSLHYIAPEVLVEGVGHSYEVDIYSLGVIFYELACGRLPFGDEDEDHYAVYQTIMTSRVKFPDFIRDKVLKKLIRQLMRKTAERRAKITFEFLKNHEVFKDINWVMENNLAHFLCVVESNRYKEAIPSPQPGTLRGRRYDQARHR